MTIPQDPGTLVFATPPARWRSRWFYVSILKLAGVPLIFLMTCAATMELLDERTLPEVPRELLLVAVLIPGLVVSWYTVRVLNRRLVCWYALHPDGIEAGPRKRGWRVSYEEVVLIRESNFGSDCFLTVATLSRSSKIPLDPNARRECSRVLVERCPHGILVDVRWRATRPQAILDDPTSERARASLAFLFKRRLFAYTLYGLAGLFCVFLVVSFFTSVIVNWSGILILLGFLFLLGLITVVAVLLVHAVKRFVRWCNQSDDWSDDSRLWSDPPSE